MERCAEYRQAISDLVTADREWHQLSEAEQARLTVLRHGHAFDNISDCIADNSDAIAQRLLQSYAAAFQAVRGDEIHIRHATRLWWALRPFIGQASEESREAIELDIELERERQASPEYIEAQTVDREG